MVEHVKDYPAALTDPWDMPLRNLVSQEEQPQDRRRKRLTISEAGRQALAAIESARHEANQNLFKSLSATERRQLLRSLRACLDRLWVVDRSGGVGHAPAEPARRRSA